MSKYSLNSQLNFLKKIVTPPTPPTIFQSRRVPCLRKVSKLVYLVYFVSTNPQDTCGTTIGNASSVKVNLN